MNHLNDWLQKWMYFKKGLTGSSPDSKIFKRQQIDIKYMVITGCCEEW